MDIIIGTTEFELKRETAVAIGKFDGVHLGHRRLLDEILDKKKDGLDACVFTFDPTPAVLFGTSDGKELTAKEEKRKFFEMMGVDVLIEFPLNSDTAAIPPQEFVRQILCNQMNASFLAAGKDLSFGAGGTGNAFLLQKMSSELGFDVKLIEKVTIDGMEVSSTYIRKLIENGRMEEAERFLGMPYSVTGQVVHGNRIGRTLGFPTVNLLWPETKLLPPKGVYLSEVLWQGKLYRSISNIGCKPTVANEKIMGVESYLYDFEKEIYGDAIEVRLHKFTRPEQKFSGLDALKEQLRKDIAAGADR